MIVTNAAEIGALLRRARLAKKMTQAQLATAVDVSRQWVIAAEAGAPTAHRTTPWTPSWAGHVPDRLTVWLGGRRAGTLEQHRSGSASFNYDDANLTLRDAPPLS